MFRVMKPMPWRDDMLIPITKGGDLQRVFDGDRGRSSGGASLVHLFESAEDMLEVWALWKCVEVGASCGQVEGRAKRHRARHTMIVCLAKVSEGDMAA